MKLLAILAGLMLCASVGAADIPSDAIGDYVGDSNACRFEPGNYGPNNGLEVKCVRPNLEGSRQTTGLSTVNGCPSSSTLVPLTQWGGESGQESGAAKSLQAIYWYDADKRLVTSWGYGIAEKFPNKWIRVVQYFSQGLIYARIGTFEQLLGPDGGALISFNQVQDLAQPHPYPGCGATPLPQPPKPFAAYCASYLGCNW